MAHASCLRGCGPGAGGFEVGSAGPDEVIPVRANRGKRGLGGSLVAGDERHVGKAICFQVGSAVEADEFGVTSFNFGPRHAVEGIAVLVTLASKQTSNFKIDDGAV